MGKPQFSHAEIHRMKMDVDSWPRCQACGSIIHWRKFYAKAGNGKKYIAWTRWTKAKYCCKKCSNDRFEKEIVPLYDCAGKPIKQGFYIFRMDPPNDHERKNPPLSVLEYSNIEVRDEIVDRACQELSR